MNKDKYISCLLLIIIVLSLSSCAFFAGERYVCEVYEVESVQIVRLDAFNEEDATFEFVELVNVEDPISFVERLNAIPNHVNNSIIGSPNFLQLGMLVIKINYRNSDYDLIDILSQHFYRSDECDYGDFVFDYDEFIALVQEYVPDWDPWNE
ncbi:MAG: hypothetical protein IKC87_04250 [Clostridia bacterium]|nr:hypothetical protein [Clostridia bacterium]